MDNNSVDGAGSATPDTREIVVSAHALAQLADRAQLLANAALALALGDLGDWRSRARVEIVRDAAAAHAADLRTIAGLPEGSQESPARSQDAEPSAETPARRSARSRKPSRSRKAAAA